MIRDSVFSASRLVSSLPPQSRKHHSRFSFLTIFLYVIGAFCMWEFLYLCCNMIGSIVSGDPTQAVVELIRVCPLMMVSLISASSGIIVFDLFRDSNSKKKPRRFRSSGIFIIILSFINIVYILFGIILGLYAGWIEFYPTFLFPTDILLISLLFALMGLFLIRSSKNDDVMSIGYDIKGKFRLFHGLFYIVSLCSFAACCYGPFVMDWSNGIFYNIMFLLCFFQIFVMTVYYRFVYCESTREYRNHIGVKSALCFLIINCIIFFFYLLSVQIFNESPDANAFALFPIDFTASFNAFPFTIGLTMIVAPFVALIKNLLANNKSKIK